MAAPLEDYALVSVRWLALCLSLAVVVSVPPPSARAQDASLARTRSVAGEAARCALSDREVEDRLSWIDAQLTRGSYGAIAWWGGWLANAAVEAALSWAKYAQTSDRLDRDVWLVNGVGSSLWVAQLLIFPMQPAYAPLRMRRLPRATAEQRRASLPRAEDLLRTAAKTEREGLHWAEHAVDMAWAVGSAAYIFGRNYGHTSKARVWRESGLELGLTVLITEASILSTPRKAIRDWKTYQARGCVSESPTALLRPRVRPRDETRPWRLAFGPSSLSWSLRF